MAKGTHRPKTLWKFYSGKDILQPEIPIPSPLPRPPLNSTEVFFPLGDFIFSSQQRAACDTVFKPYLAPMARNRASDPELSLIFFEMMDLRETGSSMYCASALSRRIFSF